MSERMAQVRGRTRPADGDGSAGSLAHGLRILTMFSTDRPVVGVSEMARELNVHRSTASRLAAALAAARFLLPAGAQGRYRLGRVLVGLGEVAAGQQDVRTVATTALNDAVGEVGETAHLAVLDGPKVVSIAIVDGWRTIRMHSWVGKASPPHCSSTGKALLAGLEPEEFTALYGSPPLALERRTANSITSVDALRRHLAQARDRGYTIDDEELELGLCCVGAPVFDRHGKVVAAVSLSGPAERMQGRAVDEAARVIRRAAYVASTELGCPRERAFWGSAEPIT